MSSETFSPWDSAEILGDSETICPSKGGAALVIDAHVAHSAGETDLTAFS